MERKKINRGVVFLLIGSLLILFAAGWYAYNLIEDAGAGKKASDLLNRLEDQKAEQNKNNNSSVIMVDGEAFCGTILIDKLEIELPVYDEWDYEKLNNAPCRFTGSTQSNDIIIAAHNYKSHFGNLNRLQIGDEISFVDAYGTQLRYSVKEITTLDGTAVTDMKSGDWDFTLFTCTKSGEQRVTVRCKRNENL